MQLRYNIPYKHGVCVSRITEGIVHKIHISRLFVIGVCRRLAVVNRDSSVKVMGRKTKPAVAAVHAFHVPSFPSITQVKITNNSI